MTPVNGNARKCYVGVVAQSSTTYTLLAGETSNSLTKNNTLIEISDKSTQYQDFIGGLKGATGSVTVHADDSDEQQKTLLAALKANTKVPIFIGELGTGSSALTGSKGTAFVALINSISETNDNGSIASRDFSFTVCGEWTDYPTS